MKRYTRHARYDTSYNTRYITRHKRKKYFRRKHKAFNRTNRFIPAVITAFIFTLVLLFVNGNHQRSEIAKQSDVIKSSFHLEQAKIKNVKDANVLCSLIIEQLGKPYKYGDSGPTSFDCSGLVQYVYSKIGINLPRVASDQAQAGIPVEKSDLQFGDILFFSFDSDSLNHTGIYIGNNYMVHAPKTGDVVKVSSIDSDYYVKAYKKAIRILN